MVGIATAWSRPAAAALPAHVARRDSGGVAAGVGSSQERSGSQPASGRASQEGSQPQSTGRDHRVGAGGPEPPQPPQAGPVGAGSAANRWGRRPVLRANVCVTAGPWGTEVLAGAVDPDGAARGLAGAAGVRPERPPRQQRIAVARAPVLVDLASSDEEGLSSDKDEERSSGSGSADESREADQAGGAPIRVYAGAARPRSTTGWGAAGANPWGRQRPSPLTAARQGGGRAGAAAPAALGPFSAAAAAAPGPAGGRAAGGRPSALLDLLLKRPRGRGPAPGGAAPAAAAGPLDSPAPQPARRRRRVVLAASPGSEEGAYRPWGGEPQGLREAEAEQHSNGGTAGGVMHSARGGHGPRSPSSLDEADGHLLTGYRLRELRPAWKATAAVHLCLAMCAMATVPVRAASNPYPGPEERPPCAMRQLPSPESPSPSRGQPSDDERHSPTCDDCTGHGDCSEAAEGVERMAGGEEGFESDQAEALDSMANAGAGSGMAAAFSEHVGREPGYLHALRMLPADRELHGAGWAGPVQARLSALCRFDRTLRTRHKRWAARARRPCARKA